MMDKIKFIIIILTIFLGGTFLESGYCDDISSSNIEAFYSIKRGSLKQDWEIFIAKDGMVTVVDKDYYSKLKPTINTKSKKLSDREFNDFKRIVIKGKVFDLDNEYVGSDIDILNLMDVDNERIKLIINGRVKEIVVCLSQIPPRLQRIIDKITAIKTSISAHQYD